MGEVLIVEEHVDEEVGGSVGEYRAHLEGRGPCEVVGWSGDEADCPVRNFLAERLGTEEVFVEPYLVYVGEKVYDTRRWMDFHVRLVDREEGAITAAGALRLLALSEEERAACAGAVAGACAGAVA